MNEQHEHKGYTIHIEYDEDSWASDPRQWDNLGVIVGWHSRYNIGDYQPRFRPAEFFEYLAVEADPNLAYTLESIEAEMYDSDADHDELESRRQSAIEEVVAEKTIVLPVYMYEHGGVVLRTTPFSCPWDSGQVGYTYTTADKIRETYLIESDQPIPEKVWNQAKEGLIGELQTYSAWLNGEVLRWEVVGPDGETVDAVSGYIGFDSVEYMIEEAKAAIDREVQE